MTRKPKSPKGKAVGRKSAKRADKASKTATKAKAPKPSKAAAKGNAAPKRPAKRPAKPGTPSPPPPKYDHVFDNPLNVRRAIYALFAVCGITFVLDLFVHRHVDHPWEGLFGFYAVYGFVACVLLVLAAKEMRKVLMRREDYYDD